MTVEEIEGLTDDEWDRLSPQEKSAAANVLLESLVSDGLAYKGADGKYRIREDVEYVGDGVAIGRKPN